MRPKITLLCCTLLLIGFSSVPAFGDEHGSIIASLPPSPTMSVSTIPANGDINPYGVAFVPHGFPHGGMLSPGDVIVSNFNNGKNLQGTGTTIVRVRPNGNMSTFFQGPMGLGLTTALGVLRRGFVLVGNVPTTDGMCSTVQQGSLMVLDRNGGVAANLVDSTFLNGPWFLTIRDGEDGAQVFVSNVLSGTVTRLDLGMENGKIMVRHATQIASGYMHRCDPAALVVGPTGLAFDEDSGVLYVASTGDNAVFAIHNAAETHADAGMGKLVYMDNVHLHGPLALILAPNGHLLTANGDAVNPDATQPSEIVEFTRSGKFVAQFPVNASGQGGAFGIAITGSDDGFRFAAVDDIVNALDVWMVR